VTALDNHAVVLGAIGTMLLIILLIAKELSDSHDGVKSQRLAKSLAIVITPLLVAFAAIVFVKVVEVL
jgi:hypothetical protein